MAIEKVREYFRKFGMEERIMEFEVSSATVELAALAVGTAPEHIAKTMGFLTKEGPVLIVAAGDARIDNRKFKETFHQKAKMLAREETEEQTGHAPGGVCPFAVREGVRCYLDLSLKRFATVYPACGSANSAIALTCEELERVSCPPAFWVDVTALLTGLQAAGSENA